MEKYLQHPAFELINQDELLFEVSVIASYGHRQEDEYHNFGHPLDAIVYAFKQIESYEDHEGPIPPRTKRNMIIGFLLHDYAVNEPLDTNIFPTAEHRSIHYARHFLGEFQEQGFDILDEDIEQVSRFILVTNPKFVCEDDYERIFCRGDIGNVGDSFAVFFTNFIAVYRENQRKRYREKKFKEMVDPIQAAKGSVAFLEQYFPQDLTIGSGDWDKTQDGVCVFVANALKNFLKLPVKLQEALAQKEAI